MYMYMFMLAGMGIDSWLHMPYTRLPRLPSSRGEMHVTHSRVLARHRNVHNTSGATVLATGAILLLCALDVQCGKDIAATLALICSDVA